MQPETTCDVGNEAVITETRASFVEKSKAQFLCMGKKKIQAKSFLMDFSYGGRKRQKAYFQQKELQWKPKTDLINDFETEMRLTDAFTLFKLFHSSRTL